MLRVNIARLIDSVTVLDAGAEEPPDTVPKVPRGQVKDADTLRQRIFLHRGLPEERRPRLDQQAIGRGIRPACRKRDKWLTALTPGPEGKRCFRGCAKAGGQTIPALTVLLVAEI